MKARVVQIHRTELVGSMTMIATLCVVAEQSVVEDSGDIDEAVAIIREIETRLEGIETAFTFRIVSDEVEVSPVQIDAVWRIDRGRFSSTETKQTRINGKPRESRRRQTWDGQRSWLVGEQSTVASVSGFPADSLPSCTALFNQGVGHVPGVAVHSLAMDMRLADDVVVSWTDDRRSITVQTTTADARWSLVIDSFPEPRFAHWTEEVRASPDAQWIQRRVFEVVSWMEHGDVQLPAKAVLTTQLPWPGRQNPVAVKHIFERHSVGSEENRDVIETWFDPEFEHGTWVMNHITGVSWRYGMHVVSLDGTGFELAEPVTADPASMIGEMLNSQHSASEADE